MIMTWDEVVNTYGKYEVKITDGYIGDTESSYMTESDNPLIEVVVDKVAGETAFAFIEHMKPKKIYVNYQTVYDIS